MTKRSRRSGSTSTITMQRWRRFPAPPAEAVTRQAAELKVKSSHFKYYSPQQVAKAFKDGKQVWLFDCGKSCGADQQVSKQVIIGTEDEAKKRIVESVSGTMQFKGQWQKGWTLTALKPEDLTALLPKQEQKEAKTMTGVVRSAKAGVWSEDQAFDLLLSFLGSSNDASTKIRDALSELAEQEAEGEVKLPPQAEAWRSFLKLAQQRVEACRGFLVGKMTELFGVTPDDVEEPTSLEPELED